MWLSWGTEDLGHIFSFTFRTYSLPITRCMHARMNFNRAPCAANFLKLKYDCMNSSSAGVEWIGPFGYEFVYVVSLHLIRPGLSACLFFKFSRKTTASAVAASTRFILKYGLLLQYHIPNCQVRSRSSIRIIIYHLDHFFYFQLIYFKAI